MPISLLFEAYQDIQTRFKPLAEVIYQPIEIGAKIVGLPKDEAIIGLCLFATFILNLILSHIHSPILRKLHCTGLGLLSSAYVFGAGFLLVLTYSMIGYVCMHVFPRNIQH